MEMPIPLHARRVTREELYQMVWDKPMIRLAEEFGITGNGLAKVCDRLDVPYPPRGYWAKKEAGKPVVTLKLPPRRDGIPSAADIPPTPPKPAPSPGRDWILQAFCGSASRPTCKVGGLSGSSRKRSRSGNLCQLSSAR